MTGQLWLLHSPKHLLGHLEGEHRVSICLDLDGLFESLLFKLSSIWSTIFIAMLLMLKLTIVWCMNFNLTTNRGGGKLCVTNGSEESLEGWRGMWFGC